MFRKGLWRACREWCVCCAISMAVPALVFPVAWWASNPAGVRARPVAPGKAPIDFTDLGGKPVQETESLRLPPGAKLVQPAQPTELQPLPQGYKLDAPATDAPKPVNDRFAQNAPKPPLPPGYYDVEANPKFPVEDFAAALAIGFFLSPILWFLYRYVRFVVGR